MMKIISNDAEQTSVLQITNTITSAAKVAQKLDNYLPDCKLTITISISAYSKNIYYNRNML